MKKIFLFIFFIVSFSLTLRAQESKINYGLGASLGATFNSFSTSEGEDSNLDLLFSLLTNFNYEGENFQFDSELYLQYGQLVRKNQSPQKTQDNFILTLMPSIRLYNKPSIRLFLQSKAETQLRKGYIGEQETNFADPMFLTNTIFIGEKTKVIESTENQQFKITYGIGYSFQNIIKRKFQLTSETSPSSSAEFIDGPSAVLNINFYKNIADYAEFNLTFNSLFLMKKDFFKSVSNSRFSSMLIASLKIWLINIEYTNRIVYDKELSRKRLLNQTLVLGFKFDL